MSAEAKSISREIRETTWTTNFVDCHHRLTDFWVDGFSVADAGDGVDDANFAFETANSAILRLTKETKDSGCCRTNLSHSQGRARQKDD
ncbi:unnamed protein product [Linum trigynum]|uniref:Uncharacterized protein n=1 Tax=Linum trigynum TaxID=586398 RepID=A0AAV2CNT2_9ROSI